MLRPRKLTSDQEEITEQRSEAPLRLGLLGGGLNSAVGYTHYLASRLDGHFEVAAGCFSRDPEINAATAARMGVPPDRCYPSKEKLLADERHGIDAVCVLTPTPDHAETVVAALGAGFDVICEKALATSVAEAGSIEAALAASDQQLFVTFNYAGYPMVREARALIEGGKIGQVQQIYCEMPQESFSRVQAQPQDWRKRDYDIPCVSLDLGVHVHQLVEFLAGFENFVPRSALTGSFGRVPHVIDTVAVLAEGDRGTLISLMWGKAALGHTNGLRFRVFGETGSIEWQQERPELITLCDAHGAKNVIERGQPDLKVANQPRYNRFKAGHPAGFVEAFANIYMDFADGLLLRDSGELPYLEAATAVKGLRFLHDAHSLE